MSYPRVNRSHIVPRMYLRGFAEGNQIMIRFRNGSAPVVTGVDNAAVRRAFYRRERRDGTPIDDVEWSLGHIESHVAPILRSLEERRPLSDEDKAALGEFVALQLLRTPRWRAWHDDFVASSTEEWRRGDNLPALASLARQEQLAETIDRVATDIGSSTQRLVKMLGLLGKAGSILASMHWTLIRFAAPRVATCDQPVHVWPLDRGSSRAVATRIGAGLLPTLEVRFPATASLAVLMTWLPEPDPDEAVQGRTHHLRNLNAFTIAEADRQWFHRPLVSAPSASGTLLPLSRQIYPRYSTEVAAASELRQEVSRRIQPRIGQELVQGELLEVVRVRRAE